MTRSRGFDFCPLSFALSEARAEHHHQQAREEHQDADAVDAVHETEVHVRVALGEERGGVQVEEDALEEHGGVKVVRSIGHTSRARIFALHSARSDDLLIT